MLALLLLSAGLAGCVDSDEESSEDEEKEELIKGCMYLSASNYNPDATVDDGSCTFLDSGVIVCDDSNSYTDDIWNSTSEKCEFTARIGESCDDGFSPTSSTFSG